MSIMSLKMSSENSTFSRQAQLRWKVLHCSATEKRFSANRETPAQRPKCREAA